jgi:hypothetical protein
LDGLRSIFARARRLRSPPERTATFLNTSSDPNRNPPRIVRIIGPMETELAEDISSRTVREGLRTAAWSWAK